jgi:ligand-binding SRPBCC domain-containing protein
VNKHGQNEFLNKKIMHVKRKEWQQFIPKPIEEIWDFFSRPENLKKLTPAKVGITMLTDLTDKEMYPGMLIPYYISPLLGIRMKWLTEITHIEKFRYFVDQQLEGPYAFWHHQHHFESKDGGTLMTDILHYKVPYGPIGTIADWVLVDGLVDDIFGYRKEAIESYFGK